MAAGHCRKRGHMTEQERIEELVEMLDSFMEKGGGHMNVVVEDMSNKETGVGEGEISKSSTAQADEDFTVRMDVFQSLDCSLNPMACAVPTLHAGIDEEPTEEVSE